VQNNQVSEAFNLRRRADHPWLWLGLMGGSVLVHAVFVIAAFPFFDRLLSPSAEVDSIPVEWVELPSIDRPTPANLVPDPVTEPTPQVPPSSEAPPQKIVGDLVEPMESGTQAPETNAQANIGYRPEARSVEPVPAPEIPEPLPLDPSLGPSLDPLLNQSPEQLAETPQGLPELPASSDLPLPPAVNEPVDQFPTIPIDRPPPDLSERIELPPSTIDPSRLAQTDIQTDTPAVVFIALLAIGTPPSVETANQPAQGEIISRNISDPATSPCFSLINPDILRSLDTPILAQLFLSSAGVVEQVVLSEPADNAAYNELVECVGRSWEFELADPVQSDPISSDPTSSDPPATGPNASSLIPLQVQITITRQSVDLP
jgi:hypothetical protein